MSPGRDQVDIDGKNLGEGGQQLLDQHECARGALHAPRNGHDLELATHCEYLCACAIDGTI